MQKGNERRKQLLSVSFDEFITKGFYGTSTRSNCCKAGISSGLLFHYRTLLDKADIAKQWTPIIQRGQELQCFHAGNPHAMCVAMFGAVQGIAQEKVRMPDTPWPDVKWLMRMVEEETESC